MTEFVSDLPVRPDTGDVLFTRSRAWVSRVTCWFTGPASHQATAYDGRYLVEAQAETGRIAKVAWTDKFGSMAADGTEWIIFHWTVPPVTPRLRCMVQCDLIEAIDFERYSYLELPLQGLDSLINRVFRRRPRQGYDAYVFRRIGSIWENGVICSKTSNRALIKNGFVPASSGLEYGNPSDTYRWLKAAAARSSADVSVLGKSSGWFNANGA